MHRALFLVLLQQQRQQVLSSSLIVFALGIVVIYVVVFVCCYCLLLAVCCALMLMLFLLLWSSPSDLPTSTLLTPGHSLCLVRFRPLLMWCCTPRRLTVQRLPAAEPSALQHPTSHHDTATRKPHIQNLYGTSPPNLPRGARLLAWPQQVL